MKPFDQKEPTWEESPCALFSNTYITRHGAAPKVASCFLNIYLGHTMQCLPRIRTDHGIRWRKSLLNGRQNSLAERTVQQGAPLAVTRNSQPAVRTDSHASSYWSMLTSVRQWPASHSDQCTRNGRDRQSFMMGVSMVASHQLLNRTQAGLRTGVYCRKTTKAVEEI